MKSNPIILVAGSVVSFLVIFVIMGFAMGLMSAGPGAFMGALMGHAPASADSVAGSAEDVASHASSRQGAGEDASPGAGVTPEGGQEHGGSGSEAVTRGSESVLVAGELPGSGASGDEGPEFLSRAEALARIEEALSRREDQMKDERAHLIALQKELEAARTHLDSLEEAAVQHLARVYGSMRPDAAAEVIVRLPPNLQTAIVARMEDKSAGKLLGAMDPRSAARVSSSMGAVKK